MDLCEWITLSHVSKEGNKRKRKKIKKNKEKNVEMTSGMEESEGKFPPLLVKSGGIRTKREEEKKR